MKMTFQDEFEYVSEGNVYYISAEGFREWDEFERVFTTLSKLQIIDEFGNELDDFNDVYNEIKEHIIYSENTEESISEEWDEEEIPYSLTDFG